MAVTFRTAPPESYVSPEKQDMVKAAGQNGTDGMAVDLVADLAHVAAGGVILPPSHFRAMVHEQAATDLPNPDKDGAWQLADGRTTIDRAEAVADRAATRMRYHAGVQDFVGSLDLSRFPGESPLQQALSAVGLLGKIDGGKADKDGSVPLFSNCNHPEGVAQQMHEALAMADSLGSNERSLLYPRHQSPLQRLEIAQDLVPGGKLRIMLEMSRKLDALSALKAQRDTRMVADPEGDEIRQRPIEDLSELIHLPADGWTFRTEAPEYWTYLAATRQLVVRERISKQRRRQAIFILVDGSGSMSGKKHWMASGVVMNRLKAVIRGDAIVWVGVYDDGLYGVKYAETPGQARGMMVEYTNGNFGGGGTNTGGAIKAAHEFIQTRMARDRALWRPDIVVLTDEDTSVAGITAGDIPGTCVHGFALASPNPALVALAHSTGGVGMENL